MAKTRSQEDEPVPQWFSRWEEAYNLRLSRYQEENDQKISQLQAMVADYCASMKRTNQTSGSDHFERALDDEELIETEVATELIGIEDETVKREANTEVISAIVKNEQIPQIQVPVSSLESSLQFHNASSDICEDFKSSLFGHQEAMLQVSHVKEMEEFSHQSTNGNGENVAHQVFGKMSQHETLGVKKKTKGFKSWRFKFKQRKQQRDRLRSANQLSITWPMLKDDCFMEDDHVYQEGLPLGLLVRFRFWKFKFINRKLQKVMRDQGFANHLKLMYDKGEHDELFIMARTVNMRSLLGIMFGIIQGNAGYGQKPVYNQTVMEKERMFKCKKGNKKLHTLLSSNNIELVYPQMRKAETSSYLLLLNGRGRLAWRAIGTGLETGETYSSSQERNELCTENKEEVKGCLERLPMSVLMEEEPDSMRVNEVKLENKMTWTKLKVKKHDNLSWKEDESRSIGCILKLGGVEITCKKVLEKIYDEKLEIVACQSRPAMMESSFPSRVIGKDGFVKLNRRYILLDDQRIWEKETHAVGITDVYSILQDEFEQVVNHTPFSVVKLERLKDLDALLLLLPGDESFQIKHKWRFKLLHNSLTSQDR